MKIALATDRNFVELSGVLIRSICARGNVPDAGIVLFADGLNAMDKKNLSACADRPLTIIDVDASIRGKIDRLNVSYNWPTAAYLRLLAPDYIDAARLLYLDCDIVVNGDLGPLFAMDLKDCAVAACGVPGNFNSGVLLIDVDRWRRENLTAKTLEWASTHGKALHDQEALNAIIQDRFLPLSPKWNCMRRKGFDYREASIIHFTGMKPDHVECSNPAKDIYLERRSETPWAGKPLRSKFIRKMHRLRQKIRRLIA
jgi:lipopolysaccharide biosynthesis glycosyltransferase